ncbi:MAG TPA: hypothetical protein PLD93_04715 [Synergistaceae bacterium]|nr:hypothetical protein [Synergistaceae bacterium]
MRLLYQEEGTHVSPNLRITVQLGGKGMEGIHTHSIEPLLHWRYTRFLETAT